MPLDVLLVDDHKIMRDGVRAILSRSAEFRVVGEAENGTDAVQCVKRLRPQLVLMDIGLPGLNGHEVCRHIRRQPWGEHIMVISLTGWGQEDDRRKSEEAGFNGHLVKPVDYDKLLNLLSTVTDDAVKSNVDD